MHTSPDFKNSWIKQYAYNYTLGPITYERVIGMPKRAQGR